MKVGSLTVKMKKSCLAIRCGFLKMNAKHLNNIQELSIVLSNCKAKNDTVITLDANKLYIYMRKRITDKI